MSREMFGSAELTNKPLPLSCSRLLRIVMCSPFSIQIAAALST